MSKISFVNGNYLFNHKARISINDRSLHFSDAVYEVIPVFNYKLIFWKEHYNRLRKSINHLNINYYDGEKILKFKCNEIIEKNNMQEGIIYIHISRGIASRNHDWEKTINPSLIISGLNKRIFVFNEKPISLISDKDIRWKGTYIKSTSLLPNVLLKHKAVENNAGECILKDYKGYITEATHSNIFLIKERKIITPPLNKNILAGITRKKILDFAKLLKIKIVFKNFKESDIYKADSTFISNSSSFIVEANKLNKKILQSKGKYLVKEIKNKFMEHLGIYDQAK